MFTHDYAVTNHAECTFDSCFEAEDRFMEESDPFFPASVTPGRTDVGSELTNDLRFPHQPRGIKLGLQYLEHCVTVGKDGC
jgi:hypothetical protein